MSSSGTRLSVLSRWVDFHLNVITHLIYTYLKDSKDLMKQLKRIEPLPQNPHIAIFDATGMYENIDKNHGLFAIHQLLTVYLKDQLPINFLTDFFGCIRMMRNNIWLQFSGASMGKLTACTYATLYYYLHELTILSKFKASYLLLLCYIDDGFIVCVV